MRHIKNFNESFIKDPRSLTVGKKYKITYPVYDDFDEGLEAEIDEVEVLNKTKNGIIVKNLNDKSKYEISNLVLGESEIEEILNEGIINDEFTYGGHIRDLMNPRIEQLIQFLNDYKEKINNNRSILNANDSVKVENMWNYIIQNVDLDSISRGNRQGLKARGDGENLPQRIKRSIKNF